MHIPDGYLGPTTCVACFAVVSPFWLVAWRRLRDRLGSLEVPYLSVAAAFVFLVMMFNVPIPGGTSGHVTGASLVALALGFWPAVIAVSCALIVQALIFGDGGITAIGANCLNMAVIQPLVALVMWRMIAPRSMRSWTKRSWVAAFAAGYFGILAAALATAFQFGLQPVLERAADGTPLYCPFPLSVSVPAMGLSHLLVGGLEGAVTAFALQALVRSGFRVHVIHPLPSAPVPFWRRRRFWIATVALLFLAPAGLWLPEVAGAGEAWGEWSPEEVARLASLPAPPSGMIKWAELWKAPVPDYAFRETDSALSESIQYIAAGLLGLLAITAIFWGLGKRQEKQGAEQTQSDHAA
ncbi:MAG: cobalt transporter CbiM [Candidatus Sumerlaea chitinivorans]|nr:cobalt transporter CbiM [Candidatus Sumerlaea chitinivorans]